jgi:hypothetical protein
MSTKGFMTASLCTVLTYVKEMFFLFQVILDLRCSVLTATRVDPLIFGMSKYPLYTHPK